VQMRVAADTGGNILFARCSLHWCWRRLHAWDDVVSYTNTRYATVMCTSCATGMLLMTM
jgi:hypothetical protein